MLAEFNGVFKHKEFSPNPAFKQGQKINFSHFNNNFNAPISPNIFALSNFSNKKKRNHPEVADHFKGTARPEVATRPLREQFSPPKM